MRHPKLLSLPFAFALAITALLMASTAPAQASDDIPRTASGKPDLSGTYDVATLTPLARPREFGDNLFLTREQADKIVAEEQELLKRGLERSDANREAPPEGGAAPVGFDESQRETLGAGNVGGYNSFWIDRGDGVIEIDGEFRTSLITEPKNGRHPKMTDEAMARMAERRKMFRPNSGTAWWLELDGQGPYDDVKLRPAAERCLLGFGSTAGPPMLPVLYNNHKRILQTDDHLMILTEMNHDVRAVRIEAEHGPEEYRKWLGDAVGRWEGDTLVVTTRHFRHDYRSLNGASSELEVIERFSRLDAETLHYEFEVRDPRTWTTVWKGDYPWPETDNKVYEYACHEGNYAMEGILKGARLLEAEAMEGR